MKKLLSIVLISVGISLFSGCSIDIKTNKELEQERAKKQETNNIISGLHQQVSGLEQTLISLNKEIDLLQPEKDSGNKQIASGSNFSNSTGTAEMTNTIDGKANTGLQFNWVEKIFEWFKNLFSGGNKESTGLQLSGLNQPTQISGLQISGTNQQVTGLESKGTTVKNTNIQPKSKPENKVVCDSKAILACSNNIYTCPNECNDIEEVYNARNRGCQKEFGEWAIAKRTELGYICRCQPGYDFVNLSGSQGQSMWSCQKL